MRRFIVAAAMAIALIAPGAPATAGTAGETESLGRSKGLEYMRAKFQGVISQATQPASCADADEPTGGGGSIGGPPADVVLHESYPFSGTGSAWIAEGSDAGGTNGRTLTAYAICAGLDLSYPSGGQQTLSQGMGRTSEVPCPAAGDEATGGGVSAVGSGMFINATNPVLPPGLVGAWFSQAFNPTTTDIVMEAHAACAQAKALDLRYRSEAKRIPVDQAGRVIASCRADEAVAGGGLASLRDGNPVTGGRAIATRPWDSKGDPRKVPDDGWAVRAYNGHFDAVRLVAYAVCKR